MNINRRHWVVLVAALLCMACNSDKPGLLLTFSPADAVVTIDGFEPADYSSPHTFEFYKPGMYRLDVKADGYIPVTMMVSVKKNQVTAQSAHLVKQDSAPVAEIAVGEPEEDTPVEEAPPADNPPPLAPTQPATKMFTVAVESVPPGALVTYSRPGSNTYTDRGTAPVDLELEATGAWEIKLELSGYETARRVVVVPASATKVILTQILSQSTDGKKPLVQPAPIVDPPPADVVIPQGKLSVTTSPETEVYVDGKAIGNTPITGYPISRGTHKILMENRELGKRKVRIVEIEPTSNVRLAEEL